MYLRAAKTEAEEAGESTEGMASSVSELREKILDLTGHKVDIMVDEDNFKSTYQIMSELSGIWDTLTDTSRANILEMIGGKRNANIVSALLENFTVAQDALEKSLDSAGSAVKENEKHLESIQGRISLLQAAFESLSATIVDDDAIKFLVSSLTGIITGVDNLIQLLGGMNNILLSIGGILVSSNLSKIFNLIKEFKISTNLSKYTKSFGALFTAITKGAPAASGAIEALGGGIAIFGNVITVLIAVAGLAVAAISNYKRKLEETRQEQIEAAETANALSDELSELYSNYTSLSDAMSNGKNVSDEYAASQEELVKKLGLTRSELEKLVEEYGDYDKAITAATADEIKRQRLISQGGTSAFEYNVIDAVNKNEMFSVSWTRDSARDLPLDEAKAIGTLRNAGYIDRDSIRRTGLTTSVYFNAYDDYASGYDINSIDGAIHAYERLYEMLEVLDQEFLVGNEVYNTIQAQYTNIKSSVDAYIEHINNLNKSLIEENYLRKIQTEQIPKTASEYEAFKSSLVDTINETGAYNTTINSLEDSVDDFLSVQSGFIEFYEDLSNSDGSSSPNRTLSKFKDKIDLLRKALDEQNETGEVAVETYNAICSIGEECAGMFDFASGKTQLNTESVNSYVESLVKETGAILASSDATSDQIAEMVRLASTVASVDEEVEGAIESISSLESVLKNSIDKTEISASQVIDLIQKYPELTSAIIETANGYIIEANAVRDLIRLKAENLRLEELSIKTNARKKLLESSNNEATVNTVDKIFEKYGDDIHSFADYEKYWTIKFGKKPTGKWLDGLRDYVETSILQLERDKKLQALIDDMLDPEKYVFGSERPETDTTSNDNEKDTESAFERLNRLYKHRVSMEQMSEKDYITWLAQASKDARKAELIDLDEYYRYQEEIYEKSKDLFKDNLDDIDKAVERKKRKGDTDSIVKLYQTQIKRVQSEIEKYRELGLDNHSDYIQELESMLWGYQDKLLEALQIPTDGMEDAIDAASDGLTTILELTQELIAWENEQAIEALEKEKDAYADIIDKKKETLALSKEQQKHDKSSANKLEEIAELQSKIDQLALDDSREAAAKKAQLEKELSEKQKAFTDEQADYAYDQQIDALDREYEAFEDSKDKEIDALRDTLNSEEKLYRAAIDRISNNWDSLYEDLLLWNFNYGSTLQQDLVSAWDAASDAVKRYGSFVGALDGVNSELPSGSDSDGYAASIVNTMKQNSSMWTWASASERKTLEDRNVTLAAILEDYLGKKISRDEDGVWSVDGENLYDKYATNTTESHIERSDYASTVVDMMKKNSSIWASATDKTVLEEKNAALAEMLASFLGKKITRGADGVWMIDGKRLYDIYHTGGIVGGGTSSQKETMALLENGEMILDEKRQKFLLSAAGFLEELSNRIGSTIDVSKLSSLSVYPNKKSNISAMLDKLENAGKSEFNFQPNINVNITHSGEMSDTDARRYGETAANAVLEKLNDAFAKRGIIHTGHNLIKT